MKTGRKTKAQLSKELAALRKINATTGTLLDLNAVLQRIIDEIIPLFAAQAASVILFDHAKQEAEVTTVYGTQPRQGEPLRYQWQGSLAGWVVEHNRPLRLLQVLPAEWPTSAKLAEELGGSLENISVLLAPLSLNGAVLGCLEVVWDPQRTIPLGDEQLLETLATQVAIAIANAQLYTERQRAEEARQQREHLFMKGPVVIFRWRAEKDWPVEYVSPNITQFGYDGDHLLTGILPYKRLIHSEDRDRVVAEVDAHTQTGVTSFEQDYRILDVVGNARWVYAFTVVGRDAQGEITHYDGYLLDITERKEAEAALRASEKQFRSLFEYAGDAIAISDIANRFVRVNQRTERLLDIPREQLLGRNAYDFITPASAALAQERFSRVFAGEQIPETVELEVVRKDGSIVPVEVHGRFLRDEQGNRTAFMGIYRDITDRKRAEAALRSAKEYAETLIKSSIDMIIAENAERWITEFNPAAEKAFGYQRAEVIGQPMDMLYDNSSSGPDLNRQIMTTGRYIGEVRNKRKNGELFDAHLEASLVHDVGGNVVGVMGISRDITDRKQAEDALRESEERYRIVSQCMSDYAFSFRMEDGKSSYMEWVTDSFTRVTGYPISTVLGKSNSWVRYIHPQDLDRVNATVRQMQPGVPTTYEFRIIRSDGEIRWIRSYAYVVRSEKSAVTRLYGAAQDITERKHAEDVFQHQRAFEQLVANISKEFLNLAPEEIEKGIVRALRAVGEFSGVDRSYLVLFREDLARMDNTHEWCAPGIKPMQSQLWNIPTSAFPWLMRTLKDFEVVHIPDVSALPPEAQAEKAEFQAEGIQSFMGVPLVSSNALIGLLGFDAMRTTKRWTEESLLLLKVVGEMIVNALERQWAAERQHQLQAQLLQTQKLEAIGTLAGGVAHDFNNILAAIMGYTELATDDVPSESRAHRNLEEVLTASRRARGLVQQLLTFSRPSHQDRRPIQLHDIVKNTLTLLHASFPKNIDIHLSLPPAMATILADPTQIEQVVMNLCVNAAYAIGEHHGVLGIGVEYVEDEHATDPASSGLSTPAAYCLTVSDTGGGIAPEMLTHIFEPFFTTKPIGQGSGMGLAIVHSIVTSHGGSITVESQPGQGTTFRVYFPPLGEPVAAREAARLSADQELMV